MFIPGLFVYLLIILAGPAEDTNIYEWRGKDRSGIYYGPELLKRWPAEGPAEILSLDNIGNGFVSPVFSGENFFITGESDSVTYLYKFNLKGVMQWKTLLGPEWMRSYPGSRSAPTVVNDMIYVGTGLGNLCCVRSDNGKIIWSIDLVKDLNGSLPLHGHSEAALIDGDKVFWTAGGKENNVVALDRFTGKLIWSAKGFGETSGYNSPRLITIREKHIIVTFSAYHLMGLDTETGRLLWYHEQDNTPVDKRTPGIGDTHCNTVLYEDGAVYYAAGDGNCGVRLDLSPDGTQIKEVWRNKGFDSFMGGILKIGDYIYGGSTARPQLRSVNAASGITADSLNAGSGALIAADDMLYYYNQKGEMTLCGINQGKIEKVSSFRISKGTGPHFSHPVINKGILYQRHGNLLMAFDIKKK
jgi:outer membrane protein assembly factor BamB